MIFTRFVSQSLTDTPTNCARGDFGPLSAMFRRRGPAGAPLKRVEPPEMGADPAYRSALRRRQRDLWDTSTGRSLKSEGYETKGRAGGKLPDGKLAVKSPDRSFFEALRKAATNQE